MNTVFITMTEADTLDSILARLKEGRPGVIQTGKFTLWFDGEGRGRFGGLDNRPAPAKVKDRGADHCRVCQKQHLPHCK